MGEWIPIEQWSRCAALERPGIIFELRNREGQSLWTRCSPSLPPRPFDWASPPVQFRAVPAEPPRHSDPLPGRARRP